MKLAASVRLAAASTVAVASLVYSTPVPPKVDATIHETNTEWQNVGFGITPAVITQGPGGWPKVIYSPNFPEDGIPVQGYPMCHRFDVDLANREFVIKVAGVPRKERIGLCSRLWEGLKAQVGCGVTFTSAIHACGTDKVSGEFFWQFEVPTGCSRGRVIDAYHRSVGFAYGDLECGVGQRQTGLADDNFPSDCDTHPENWDPTDPNKDYC